VVPLIATSAMKKLLSLNNVIALTGVVVLAVDNGFDRNPRQNG
jgi:hypothetical protein